MHLKDHDLQESMTGSRLLNYMASHFLQVDPFHVHTQKYEKPRAYSGSREISVSFSHTNDAISAAVSETWIVGCDMEREGRPVHARLSVRIRHSEETDEMYNTHQTIQIWTLKEAALKCIGTGLRKPMNSVKITPAGQFLFDVEFDDGKKAKICSFQHQEHWISICYHNNADI